MQRRHRGWGRCQSRTSRTGKIWGRRRGGRSRGGWCRLVRRCCERAFSKVRAHTLSYLHSPWSRVQSKSYVNLPQTPPLRGGIRMGVDQRNHPFAPGLPPGRSGRHLSVYLFRSRHFGSQASLSGGTLHSNEFGSANGMSAPIELIQSLFTFCPITMNEQGSK